MVAILPWLQCVEESNITSIIEIYTVIPNILNLWEPIEHHQLIQNFSLFKICYSLSSFDFYLPNMSQILSVMILNCKCRFMYSMQQHFTCCIVNKKYKYVLHHSLKLVIFMQGRQTSAHIMQSMLCLLMFWPCKEPGHQQTWHWFIIQFCYP